jgi:hypothetical protein
MARFLVKHGDFTFFYGSQIVAREQTPSLSLSVSTVCVYETERYTVTLIENRRFRSVETSDTFAEGPRIVARGYLF